jgi:hypothetical protein
MYLATRGNTTAGRQMEDMPLRMEDNIPLPGSGGRRRADHLANSSSSSVERRLQGGVLARGGADAPSMGHE